MRGDEQLRRPVGEGEQHRLPNPARADVQRFLGTDRLGVHDRSRIIHIGQIDLAQDFCRTTGRFLPPFPRFLPEAHP